MTVVPEQKKSARAKDRNEMWAVEGDAPRDHGFERVPPQDLDSEQSALGGMLLSKDVIPDVTAVLKGEDFYRPAHELVFQAIVDLYAKGEPADPITVAAELTKRGEIARVGGASYLHTLVQCVPTAANAEYYAEIVHERAVLRRLVEAGTAITQMGYSAEGDVDDVLATARGHLEAVAEAGNADHGFRTVAETMEATLDAIDQAQKGSSGLTGIGTGFTDLDSLTSGLQPGQVIVVAGRPAMGKSTLGLDLARACAYKHGRTAAFVSLEMDFVKEINMRLISAEAKVALHHIRSGGLTDEDWVKIARHLPRITEGPLLVDDCPTNWQQIQAKLRRLKVKRPDLSLIVLDYMQLIELGGRRPDSREREVSEVSRGIKLLAKELNVPIVALAQLNRGPEQRTDKKPVMSDLRESGSQEQDADIIILLHREDAYEKESPRAGEADFIVAKHRNGPTATVTTAFQGHYSRFVDMAQT